MAEVTAIQGCRQLLRARPALVALVDNRIRPFGELKQNELLPAITLFRLSARRWPTYGNVSSHVNPNLQLDVYAKTQAEALRVAEQARLAMQDPSQSALIRGTMLTTERDWYEEATESYRVLQQWTVHHAE